jgi:hypothetical protein
MAIGAFFYLKTRLDGRIRDSLPVAAVTTQSDADQLLSSRLSSLSASGRNELADCGSTSLNKPNAEVKACAEAAFEKHKPFHILYYGSAFAFFKSAYGLAGEANGNVYEVEYDSRGILNLGLRKGSEVFDGNRVRVTT